MIQISGFEKMTLLDYPGKVACIVFLQGCNYKCKFCQNSKLIPLNAIINLEKEFFEYLEKRKNILDGVVISGGEPTISINLIPFIKRIKEMGLSVKLDTNGTNPNILEKLLKDQLIDYVAMDIKTIFEDYQKIVGVKNPLIENVKKSILLIKNSNIDHEFRITIMKEFHDIEKLKDICNLLGKNETLYIQNFRNGEDVIEKSLTPFEEKELLDIKNALNEKFPNVNVRGI